MNAPCKIAIVFGFTIATAAFGQGSVGNGTFQDLSLQDGNLPALSITSRTNYVPFGPAFPGWSGSVGGVQPSQVLVNSQLSAGIGITFSGAGIPFQFPPIGNEFTALLVTYPLSSVTVSLFQTGMVPAGADTIQIKIGEIHPAPWTLSLGGQSIDMVPSTATASYTLYTGNVSPFAGKVETLAVSAFSVPTTAASVLTFCDLSFQGALVPEAGTLSYFGLGALLVICHVRAGRTRLQRNRGRD